MKRKKKSFQQWIGILFYMLIGAGSGILLVQYLEHFEDISTGMLLLLFIFLFLSLFFAILLQITIHEGGHLLFGLATGYTFSSFRIFSWMWIKKDGKIQHKHLTLAGTGGQCLMSPPDLKDRTIPVLLYNFGGAILNLITSAIFFCLSFLLPPASFFTMFLRLLALVGTGFAIMNGLPLHIGPVDNDGCNAISMMKDKEAVRAFWIQMKANEQVTKDIRLKDMPEEWFTMPKDEAMKNSLVATIGVLVCNRLMDEHRFAEAEKQMDHLLSAETKVTGLHKSLMTCDRVYVELITQNRQEKLDALMTKEQKDMMKSMKNFPSVLRTHYAYALLAEQDTEKASQIEKQFNHCAVSYPYPSEITGERELMQIARDLRTEV